MELKADLACPKIQSKRIQDKQHAGIVEAANCRRGLNAPSNSQTIASPPPDPAFLLHKTIAFASVVYAIGVDCHYGPESDRAIPETQQSLTQFEFLTIDF